MRIVFIGCVQFSYTLLSHMLERGIGEVAGIVTKRSSAVNADFCTLEPLAEQYGIPCHFYDTESGMEAWVRDRQPDVVYCFGWSHLLKRPLLELPSKGVIGYHPTALPHNRGRHPIIWTLALGLKRTASTFFVMDTGADSGDLVSQVPVEVEASDNARTLYDKLTVCALGQVERLTEALSSNTYQRVPQNAAEANYWRKRSRKDGVIDWRMSAETVHNLVRALSRPYPGASFAYGGEEVIVWASERLDDEEVSWHIEPGQVLRIEGSAIVVKCGQGAIRLVEHTMRQLPKAGGYL